MKKTLLYLATLATLTTCGAVALNTVNNNFFGATIAHANGTWVLLHPLDPNTAQYVKYDPVEGVILTDAGDKLYNAGIGTKSQYIFTTAPYIRDESQVTQTGPNAGGWFGQLDTITFTPKDSSVQPISVQIASPFGDADVKIGTSLLSDSISQIEDYYNRDPQTVDVDYTAMQAALGLERAGLIPKDSKIQATVDAMRNGLGKINHSDSSTNSASTPDSSTATSSPTANTNGSNPSNQVSDAKHHVQLAQTAVKKAAQNVKANKHKSKQALKHAKKQYKQAKAALKKANAALKKLTDK
ncbi:hypothetical protein MOO44_01120 (plasmid) [Nicoliella spurrieriana]|uniref:Uncharacterized protein n=1 Tax=Nicoliella spurrieriana TaxID=2925830 RepID=A0A976X4U9_9LACO|nr:hypothetical protein [Nicoliella spurrieriana]UQS85951.1 hypothetical protein MOO44_01120 [Nicoliella spurrieriana]